MNRRCEFEGCRKKLALSDFPCRCKKTFCPNHRYESEHACIFDYQKEAKVQLEKTVIECKSAKMTDVI